MFITWDLFPGMVEVSTFPRCRVSKPFTTFESKESIWIIGLSLIGKKWLWRSFI